MASASRFYLSLAFFCLALLVTICRADETKSDDEKTIRDDDVSARIQSRSGKIMIVRDNDGDNSGDGSGDGSGDDSGDGVDDNDNDDNDDDDNDNDDDDDDDDDFSDDNEDLLSFEMDAIQEKDADGNDVGTLEKHSVDSFDKVDFTISGVQRDGDYQGLKTVNINMSTFLDDPKANLEVMLYLFREDGTVTFGSETFAVQAGTVKFNVKVSNWDFCDGSPVDCSEAKAGEFLDISMKIRSKGSPAEVDDEDRKKKVCKKEKPDNDNNDGPENDNDDDDDCPIIYDMGGDSEMLLNKGVMNDYSKYTAMPPGFPKFEIEDGEKKFKFRIPKFDDNVVVDPSVTPGRVPKRAASHACWHQLHFGFTVFLLVVALFVAN